MTLGSLHGVDISVYSRKYIDISEDVINFWLNYTGTYRTFQAHYMCDAGLLLKEQSFSFERQMNKYEFIDHKVMCCK